MNCVVDASVAVKWFVDEPGHGEALALLASDDILIAPDFALVEIASVLARKVVRGEIGEEQAMLGIDAAAASFDRLPPATPLLGRAARLSFDLRHAVYDCLYLALAQSEGATLVTADDRFREKCVAAGLGPVMGLAAATAKGE